MIAQCPLITKASFAKCTINRHKPTKKECKECIDLYGKYKRGNKADTLHKWEAAHLPTVTAVSNEPFEVQIMRQFEDTSGTKVDIVQTVTGERELFSNGVKLGVFVRAAEGLIVFKVQE